MKIPENIKAVIFDVDGVIIDSEPTWIKSHDEFFGKHNVILSEDEKSSLRGIGLKQLIIRLHKDFNLQKSVDDLLAEYREIFYKNFSGSGDMKAVEGVEEVVKYFYNNGLRLAIATGGHSVSEMEKMLTQFNLLKYFEVIVSGDEVEKGKPDPDVFLLAAEKLKAKPSECLVIEDSINGVTAGKAAGMVVWGVNKNPAVYDNLKKTGVDEVYYSFKELL